VTPRKKLALAVAVLALYTVGGLALLVVALVPGLGSGERHALREAFLGQPAVVIVLGLFFLAGLALLVRFFFQLYVVRAVGLTEQVKLIGSVNPGHRITPGGPAELRELAAAVNELARRYETLESDVDRRVRDASLDAREERNRLASVLARVTQPMLVCNGEGRILLYNDGARQQLERETDESVLGLGRSVFTLLDRNVVGHALARARRRASSGDLTPLSRVVTTAAGGELVRVDVAPVPDAGVGVGGFLLMLEAEGRPGRERAPSRDEVLARDLAESVSASVEREAGTTVTAIEADPELWLEVDMPATTRCVAAVASRLRTEHGVKQAALRLRRLGADAGLDLIWEGEPLSAETLRAWWPVSDEAGEALVSSTPDGEQGRALVRVLLSLSEAEPLDDQDPSTRAGGRPLSYDFDLFDTARRRPDWDARLLGELVYTVFDVETTGLSAASGDEIVSIGAVRVVGGRVLHREAFDRLVDPRRSVSEESLRAHGISREMLEGQPVIEEVLPAFARFAEGSVFVGHNVAFDMSFLAHKEKATGIRFDQPVLDTLLVSSVIHPASDDHSLEGLAERLGVSVVGRHSALGDALLTAELFLKLIPLLAEEAVLTLEDALEASRRSPFAKLSY
jgi:DNA polymerase III subunit epsilon